MALIMQSHEVTTAKTLSVNRLTVNTNENNSSKTTTSTNSISRSANAIDGSNSNKSAKRFSTDGSHELRLTGPQQRSTSVSVKSNPLDRNASCGGSYTSEPNILNDGNGSITMSESDYDAYYYNEMHNNSSRDNSSIAESSREQQISTDSTLTIGSRNFSAEAKDIESQPNV